MAADLHAQALAHLKAGRIAEAAALYQDLLVDHPDDPEAHHFLGVLAFREGHLDRAEQAFSKAVASRPDWSKALSNLGSVLVARGRQAEALSVLEQAVSGDADNIDAWYNLGCCRQSVGRVRAAEAAYGEVLRRNPDHGAALSNLAALYLDRGAADLALETCRRAVRADPGNADAQVNLGLALYQVGETAESVRVCRAVLALGIERADLYNNLGNALTAEGQTEQAREAYRKAVELDPESGRAMRHLAMIHKFTSEDDAALLSMKRLVEQGRAPTEQLMQARFGLAKAYEDLGHFERAFDHLEAANRLKRSSFEWHLEDEARRFRALFEEYEQATVEEGFADASPLFIIGMPRSGTTLVEQILASHSRVTAGGEMLHFPRLADSGMRHPQELGAAYVAAAKPPGADCFTDKLPANFLQVGRIARALPQARLIHCRRDPVDTCLSCYRRLFTGFQGFAYDLRELGGYYRLYEDLMTQWERLLPGRILTVQYEDLVEDLEGQSRRLIAGCGLDWEAACLDFHRTRRAVRTASADQVRQPIYRDALGRWRKYGERLNPLLEALGPLVSG
ncbi:tetratricopeptide repeat-containing sulfotransferase family protein [Magnetospira thiophila]